MRFIFSSVIGLLLSSGAGAQAVVTSAAWVTVKQQALWYGLAPVGFALVVGLVWLVNRHVRSSRTSVAAPLLRFGKKPLWWAVVVFLIGLAGNAWLVQRAQDQIYTSALFRFQQQVEHLDADIQSRLEKVGGILNDMRATVVTHDDLSRVAFRDWVMARQLGQEFSGVRGFGLIDRVARSDVPAFVARQRSTGAPTFAVHSAGDATDLFVVKYVEPLDTNLAAQGFDVGSEAVLRVAAERAMLEGHPALTGRISLVQDAASRPGFLLYVPIFKKSEMPSTIEQRVRAFRGWAYAPIVAASFFEPTLAATQDLVDFQLFDGLSVSAEALVYDSDFPMGVMAAGTVGTHPDALFSQLLPTVLGGGVFQLLVTSTPNFERTVELDGPANSALVGSVLSLLAGFSVWLLMVGRERSEALARAMSQDLTREKERTQSILSGTNVGTWEWNVITKEFKVNERFVTMMGFTMDEVLPDVWSFWKGRTHLDDWARATNTQVMLLRGQQPLYSCDTRVLRKDGEWMWVLSRGQVMTRTPDGRVEWLGGIHTDITDAKRHEENLRDAEAFLERAGRHAGFGAWQVNLKTNEILWNDQTCEIHGVEAGFRPTMEQAIAFYPGDAARQMQVAIEKAVTQGLGWDLITPFVNAEGEARWVRSVGEVEFDDSGAVRLLGALQDVTKAHKSQLALEQATEQAQSVNTTLQSVLDSAVDVAVIATDLTQIITVFNKGAERLLGYSADEVVGKLTSASFFAAEQLKVVRESLALLLGREPTDQEVFNDVVSSAQQSEWAFVRKDRSRVNVSLVISPMRNVAGEMVGHLGIAQDITRQQAYEDSLRHAKQAAEQSSLAKSQFLANMSHEIRTPMNAILGMLKLLQNTPLSVRQSDYATKTESAAKSLLMLLNDILDFSKVEAGKLEMDPEPFKVDQLLSDLSVILSANLGSKSLDVLFDVDPRIPPSLVGDALRIKQILINLGGNAIKFTAKGQVVVQWRLLHLQDARAQVEITVRDTGIGIAIENQSRIFEGFSQAEASTTRKFGGTGLGLVISQRLIALMGGELVLTSAVGEGSSFSFVLDLPVGQAEAKRIQDIGTNVLLVDDNPVALAAGATLMESLGWRVVQANSGEAALNHVRQCLRGEAPVIHALYVDWQMPGMDGWQTLREVRRLYGDRPAPVLVMLSGQGRELLAQRTVREQELLNGFLVKPLTATMFSHAYQHAYDTPVVVDSDERVRPVRARRLDGMNILVVEDNPINQQVAKELLSNEGAVITLADNGRIGVDMIAAAQPQFDVVLMDLQMPVMDGISAARAIRGELGLHSLPVIAMTANAMASDRQACLAVGMNDHVGKPFDLNHLVATVVRHTQWISAVEGAVGGEPPTAAVPLALAWPQGMDGVAALARMGGNAALFARTLQAFAHDAGLLPSRLDALVVAGDADAARRELHALKGLTATLGLKDLSDVAAQAEKMATAPLAARAPELADLISQICERLAGVLPSLTALARQLVADAVVPEVAGTDGVVLLDQLRGLLSALVADDMAAMELHAELRQACGDELADAMAPLDAAMAELNFELAAAECEILMGQLTQ